MELGVTTQAAADAARVDDCQRFPSVETDRGQENVPSRFWPRLVRRFEAGNRLGIDDLVRLFDLELPF